MDKEIEKTIQNLKDKIIDGWAMAHDPICSEGFRAADTLIKYYEEQINIYKEINKTPQEK